MINLLPPDTKRQIRAARTNVVLVNYCVLIFMTALLLGGVFALGFWADLTDRQAAETAKAETQTAAQPYNKIRAQAQDFAKDLGIAKTILASNVSFSQLTLDIAAVVPPGVILSNLSLSPNAQNTPIDINGRAISYDAAVALKNSLENSPIFEKVNILNISQTDTAGQGQVSPLIVKYPFVVGVKAQFSPKDSAKKEGS